MNLIIGVSLCLFFVGYSAYLYFTGGDFLDPRTMLQLFVAGAGSSVILYPRLVSFVKTAKMPNILPERKKKEMNIPSCNNQVKTDYDCLHYLRDRAIEIESQEALDLVIKLNSILFSDSCKMEDDDKQNEEGEKQNEEV